MTENSSLLLADVGEILPDIYRVDDYLAAGLIFLGCLLAILITSSISILPDLFGYDCVYSFDYTWLAWGYPLSPCGDIATTYFFLLQAYSCLQFFVFLIDLCMNTFFSEPESRLVTFVYYTLIWMSLHTVDGFIIFFFRFKSVKSRDRGSVHFLRSRVGSVSQIGTKY
ncbi:unnamed protein product, partial [Mesorhabditis belari]|uniref:7TM GPCR serpentine receptor class x (Srx) domain-containing protein n=1 Tax=Mesorhabditis belari TaxID=2138241 RepID=A0AAF3FTA1_9BILA